MERLLYVRHGETEDNAAQIFSGQRETPLTPKGIAQAQAAGRDVLERYGAVDKIICSPLERTVRTAELIAAELGHPLELIEQNSLFIERALGELEGTSRPDFFAQHDYAAVDMVAGAERLADLYRRAEQAFAYVACLSDTTVLVVGHGAFGRVFRNVARSIRYDEERRTTDPLKNASVIELVAPDASVVTN